MENLRKEIHDHYELLKLNEDQILKGVVEAGNAIINAIRIGKKIILFGNGGSAADAQHIAAEFTGRFVSNRRALPAIALTTDSSAVTAIGNDFGFENIFSRQVEALAVDGDVIIGITTSGNSRNVISALEVGNALGCVTVALTGRDGGIASKIARMNINISHQSTARVQELHILIGHLICSMVEDSFL